MGSVPIRLRQALGFAERGCIPRPTLFLGPSAPNPIIRRGLGHRPKRVWAAAHKARPIRRRPCVNRIGTLRQAFADLSQRWGKLGADVGLGIGIASGFATMGVIVEGRFDYTPIGNAVNLAARLSDQAQDGEILMSRRSWAEVEQVIASRSAGKLSLKGIAQPVDVFLLEGLKEDESVVPPPTSKKPQ